ncbi:MAG: MBL fold metallo-hydrolase [Bacteroidaceae bacterium]|nr:MBL fold metallo-hydrolase [Bacteroidaceae bacterium]
MAETSTSSRLHIKKFVVNMIEESCYIVHDESGEAVIIDPGIFYPEEEVAIQEYVNEHQLRLTHMLLTHGHLDHIFGTNFIYQHYGIGAMIHKNDLSTYEDIGGQCQFFFNRRLELPSAPVERFLKEGDMICFGQHQLKVIETPGHTQGGVCFYCQEENVLFSGDTLFRLSIGRTDLAGGNGEQLLQSIREQLFSLPDSTQVFPGHGPSSTIGEEKKHNMYVSL